MIIFLYGQDSYRSRQKLKEIIAKYENTHKNGLSLRYIDLLEQETSFEAFKLEFISFSMFQETKLFVLQNCFDVKEFREQFLKNAKSFQDSKDVIVVYEKDKVLETTALFKFLKKEAKSQEFKLLTPLQLKLWVKKEFSRFLREDIDCKIEDNAMELLIEFTGNDLWRLSNEIIKLVSFRKNIKKEDVELLVEPSIEADIFKTIDFLSAKNKKQAILLIRKHLQKGENPLYLLSMINFQFRNLLLVKSVQNNDLLEDYSYGYYNYGASKELAAKLKMHPFVVKKALIASKNFTLEELKKIYHKIFRADVDIKTGRIKPETALYLLISEI